MAASTDVPTIDTTTVAWADYDAVVNGGMSPSDRAKETDKTVSTVGANIRRVKDALEKGATLPDGTTLTENGADNAPTLVDTLVSMAPENVQGFMPALFTEREKVARESDRIRQQIQTLNDRLTEAEAAVGAWDARMKDAFDIDMSKVLTAHEKALTTHAAEIEKAKADATKADATETDATKAG